jgi:hypothetical protein
MGDWIDGLNLLQDDYKIVWTQFQQKFHDQFTDSQQQQHACIGLENLKMRFPNVDQYIAKFEDLVWLAGYTVGNEETINLFLYGLTPSILDDVVQPLFVNNYIGIKEQAIQLTKARQMTEAIKARRGIGSQHPFQRPQGFQNFFGSNQQHPQYSNQRNAQLQRPCNQQTPQYSSLNAPRPYNNIPVPMDTSARFRAPYNWQINANIAPQNDGQAMVAQTNPPCHLKGPCFNCREMGHFAAQCLKSGQQINYMNYEEPNQIPMPTIQPQVNVVTLKAQIDALSPQDNETLISMMEESQDFHKAWSNWPWSSVATLPMYLYQAGNRWLSDFSYIWSQKGLKQSC